MAGRGRKFTFHGAFARKIDAEVKSDQFRQAFVRRVRIRGKTRYLVLVRRRR